MKTFIIDDDPLSIFYTKNILILENATQDITSFLCAEAALEALNSCNAENLPATIFLDLNMPTLDGWDFLEALLPLEPRLKNKCTIYILTSSLDPSDLVRMKAYSLVANLIQKPIQRADIKMIVWQHSLIADSIK